MKQKHIFIYFINCCFFFCSTLSFAQNDSIVDTVKDSIKIKQKYGIRLGGDLSKLMKKIQFQTI